VRTDLKESSMPCYDVYHVDSNPVQMIEEGRMQPWKVTSHQLPLTEAAMGYAKFDAKEYNKVHSSLHDLLCRWLLIAPILYTVRASSVQLTLTRCEPEFAELSSEGQLCLLCAQVVLKPLASASA
jgi:hypothetical protein